MLAAFISVSFSGTTRKTKEKSSLYFKFELFFIWGINHIIAIDRTSHVLMVLFLVSKLEIINTFCIAISFRKIVLLKYLSD